jgi:hypothetical protein
MKPRTPGSGRAVHCNWVGALLLALTSFFGCARHEAAEQIESRRLALVDTSMCPPGTNVILGTGGDDHLVGTNADDCILGLGGNDIIEGGNGNDWLFGGEGDDRLDGGNGTDHLFGGTGDDILIGGNGVDYLDGGDGNDILLGDNGSDVLAGGNGNDVLLDTKGSNSFDGGGGTDFCSSPGPGCEQTGTLAVGCTSDASCGSGQHCLVSVGLCIYCQADASCNDGNVCTDDACRPVAGCGHVLNTASCSDGNACTHVDTCQAGTCVGSSPVVCTALDQCHDVGTCDPGTGACSNPAKADGTVCSDGNVCNGIETCRSGRCVAGQPLVCDDGNVCTDDVCDPNVGCRAIFNTEPCDDGNVCTVSDSCAQGACVPGSPLVCDDGNPCTVDSCNAVIGCTWQPLCETFCFGGHCGVCQPGDKRCASGGVEICDATGNWMPGTACPFDCAAGACVGECLDGTRECRAANVYRCVGGAWQEDQNCGSICLPNAASLTCAQGRCVVGECLRGYRDANGDPSDGCEQRDPCDPPPVEICFEFDRTPNGDGQCEGATGVHCTAVGAWSPSMRIDTDGRAGGCIQRYMLRVPDECAGRTDLGFCVDWVGDPGGPDMGQCGNPGTHCAKANEWTDTITLDMDNRDGWCEERWQITGSSNTYTLRHSFNADGDAGQCKHTGEYATSPGQWSPWIGPDADDRPGGCTLSLRIDAPDGNPPAIPVAGLAVWLDASAITGVADGAAVTTWRDRGGIGNDVLAKSAAAPIYRTGQINGLPVVRFDAGTDELATPYNIGFVDDPPFTVFLVANISSSTPHMGVFWAFGDPSRWAGGGVMQWTNGNPGFETGWWVGAYPPVGSFEPYENIPSIVTMRRSPGPIGQTTEMFFDGSHKTMSGASQAPNMSDGPFSIGAWWGQRTVADYAEALVYRRTLSDADRAQVECYLAAKYAIALDPSVVCGGGRGTVLFSSPSIVTLPAPCAPGQPCPPSPPPPVVLKSGSIEKVGGGVVVGGLNYPSGLAFDAQGNLYFGDVTTSPVRVRLKKRAGDGTVTDLGTVVDTSAGFVALGAWGFDIAVSSANEIFFNSPSIVTLPAPCAPGQPCPPVVLKSGSIEKLGGGVVVGGLNYPSGLAFDAQGNLYFGDVTTGPIRVRLKKRAGDGTVTDLGTVVDTSAGYVAMGAWGFDVAVSAANEIFFNSPSIVAVPAPCAPGQPCPPSPPPPVVLKSGSIEKVGGGVVVGGLNYPSGLAFDTQGNLYFGDVTSGPIRVRLKKRAGDGAVTDLGTVVDTSAGAVAIGPWGFDVASTK